MTEGDYQNGCGGFIYYEEQINDRSEDYSYKIHFLASNGNPEVFKDEFFINIKYDLDEFEFEAVYTDLVIYRYELYDGPHRSNPGAFEILPGSTDDKENQVVKVKTNTLRGSYLLGRP